jgi:hypothetical protein
MSSPASHTAISHPATPSVFSKPSQATRDHRSQAAVSDPTAAPRERFLSPVGAHERQRLRVMASLIRLPEPGDSAREPLRVAALTEGTP